MRGETMLTLDFEFEFSHNGEVQKEFAVKLRAPGLDQYAIHNRMAGLASEAQVGLAQRYSKIERPKAADIAEAVAAAEQAVDQETESEAAARVLDAFATGLGPERFAETMDWLRRTLTGNAKLASIGDTGTPIRDKVWESIADQGGLDAVNLILGTFIAFFMDGPARSRKGGGSGKPSTPPSGAVVH